MTFPGAHLPTRTKAERERRDAAFRKWCAEEDERIRRQRIYLTTLSGRLRDELVKKMLGRAWDLLEANRTEEADAILDFVPEPEARRLLDEFFWDES